MREYRTLERALEAERYYQNIYPLVLMAYVVLAVVGGIAVGALSGLYVLAILIIVVASLAILWQFLRLGAELNKIAEAIESWRLKIYQESRDARVDAHYDLIRTR
ncbi:MAG: hypothetical protein KAW09_05150, partial [Thermoplasmata archaeon]|nr:hypothetical protein [Thermoplasmata archaeon]